MVIFSDGFESNDFSAWTSQRTFAGGAIAISNTQAHHGTYSCKASFSSAIGEGWTRKTFAGAATVYGRWYVFVDRLPDTDNDGYGFGGFGGSSNDYCGYLYIFRIAGVYIWRLRYYDGGTGNWQDLAGVDALTLNTWYCVEIYSHAGDGTAAYKAYINGVEGCNVTGKTQTQNLEWFEVGGIQEAGSSSSTVNVYSDCVVVADAYIGPEAAAGGGGGAGGFQGYAQELTLTL
jgi:hypothetical protein